ncbi:MAG: DUF512 domain-containing protein, partial [Acidobacteriota bacterium]
SSDDEYGLYDGYVQTILPDGDRARYEVADYRSCTNEYVFPASTAKYAKNRFDSYAAGALARFNVNYDQLHPEAKKFAESLGMKSICTNPYFNSVAQVVEIVHSAHEGLRLFDELIESGVSEEPLVAPTRFGSGASAVEVPRGILFHEYTYDEEGLCTDANCIIPTGQNHANIQADFDALLPQFKRGAALIDAESPVTVVTGSLFAPLLEDLLEQLDAPEKVRVLAVENHFFGGNVAVAGLLTASDIVPALIDDTDGGVYLVPASIANADGLLLDDVPAVQLGMRSGRDVRLISCDARGLLQALTDVAAGSPSS